MPNIYDNQEKTLSVELKECLQNERRTDISVGYFNLRGWRLLADAIQSLQGEVLPSDDNPTYCRLLVGMYHSPQEDVTALYSNTPNLLLDLNQKLRLKQRLLEDFKCQLCLGIPQKRDEVALHQLIRQLKEGRVTIKLHLAFRLHAKLYLVHRHDTKAPLLGYVGSSNLTLSGLEKQGELTVDVVDEDAARKLETWFLNRWEDRASLDITQDLIQILENSWATPHRLLPYHIYLRMAYFLSQDARSGALGFTVPRAFENVLLPFQINAVLASARILEKRGGMMIGDVVGLGKTITATALAKLFQEERNASVLVIAPPNLTKMWESYMLDYNISAKTISSGSVTSHTFAELRRFSFVIVDESHNFRNEKGSRYRAVKNYLSRNADHVVLLTATPYNKSFSDLGAQIGLFLDDEIDLGISPYKQIKEEGGVVSFTAKHQIVPTTLRAFKVSEHTDDWREIMRLFLVRRTRSFIKRVYAQWDAARDRHFLVFPNGNRAYFPNRIPKAVTYSMTEASPYARLYAPEMVDVINHLHLSRYGLYLYVKQSYTTILGKAELTSDELTLIDNMTRAGQRLRGFARTNLFKRLESSGHAFLLSIARHIFRNHIFIYALENDRPLPIGTTDAIDLDAFMYTDEEGDFGYDDFSADLAHIKKQAGNCYEMMNAVDYSRYTWLPCHLFDKKTLIRDIQEDADALYGALQKNTPWNPALDAQLNALENLITQKHAQDKVLIFTQFADTACYLYKELKERGISHIGCATGMTKDPTELAHQFSPISNKKKSTSNDLRILISTDVLSEGQNLQDSHVILNYDLPWALIRLIQRAGRVDRIGQQHDTIYCYSFLPENGIDTIINLRNRLRERITNNAETVGSDEVFFAGDPINIQDLYNESVRLDDQEDDEIDLGSYAYQVWEEAIKNNPTLKNKIESLPQFARSTRPKIDSDLSGVVALIHTSQDNMILVKNDPHGIIQSTSQLNLFRSLQCYADTYCAEELPNHLELAHQAATHIHQLQITLSGGQLGTKTGTRYKTYQKLKAYIESVAGTLFESQTLKNILEDLYNHPLSAEAKRNLSTQLKIHTSDERFCETLMMLHDLDRLVIRQNSEIQVASSTILCSMGIN